MKPYAPISKSACALAACTLAACALSVVALLSSCGIKKQPSGPAVSGSSDDPPAQNTSSPTTAPRTERPNDTDPAPVTDPPTAETDPPVLYPPRVPALRGDEILLEKKNGRYSFRDESLSGTPLYLVTEGEGVLNRDGSFTVTVKLLLHHYSIYCKERLGCFLRVGDETLPFDTDVISQKTSEESLTLIRSLTVTLDPGQVFEIEALVPFYGTYNGSEVNILTYYNRFAVIP